MTGRFVIAPEGARDLAQIWRYIRKHSSVAMADRVEAVIRGKFVFLAENPRAGHVRKTFSSLFLPDRLPFGKEAAANCVDSPWTTGRGADFKGPLLEAASVAPSWGAACCAPTGAVAAHRGRSGTVDGPGSRGVICCRRRWPGSRRLARRSLRRPGRRRQGRCHWAGRRDRAGFGPRNPFQNRCLRRQRSARLR